MQKANIFLRSIFLLFIFPSQVFLGVVFNHGLRAQPALDLIPARSASEAETAEFLAGASGWYDDKPQESLNQQPAGVKFSRSAAHPELALCG